MKHIVLAAALALSLVPANAAAAVEIEEDAWSEGAPQTINAYDGVYCFGDRVETYYSSKELYHYMTPEWVLDDEGFYRTEEGYYVVAASDMEYGTVFEGSKGMCQVLDCGCACGVTDYYTEW